MVAEQRDLFWYGTEVINVRAAQDGSLVVTLTLPGVSSCEERHEEEYVPWLSGRYLAELT